MKVRNVYRLSCCACMELLIQVHHGYELHNQNMRHVDNHLRQNLANFEHFFCFFANIGRFGLIIAIPGSWNHDDCV